jgi:hypothetical protein
LAAAALVRGAVPLSDVSRNMVRLRPSLRMVSWNPDGFKLGSTKPLIFEMIGYNFQTKTKPFPSQTPNHFPTYATITSQAYASARLWVCLAPSCSSQTTRLCVR